MSYARACLRPRFLFAVALALFAALPANAAKLTPDKNEITVGETVFVKLEADLALLPDWSASDELEILASSGKGATVKGVKAGKAKLTVKYVGGKKTANLTVRESIDRRESATSAVALPVIVAPAPTGRPLPPVTAPALDGSASTGQTVYAMSPTQPVGSYDDFASALLAKVQAGGTPSERELLALMTQPGSVASLTSQWRAAGASATIDKALALRRAIVQRVIDRIGADAGDDLMAVIALGSWAESLNPGDMDVLMRANPAAATRFNRMVGDEINKVFGKESDDLVRQFLSEGRTFTVETFEIFVSTFEDFGNLQFANLTLRAKDMAAAGDVDGAIRMIRDQADDIITKNLRAQSWTAAHSEYYPGVAGQDFVRKYFNTPGKARVWFKSPAGPLSEAGGGLTVSQIGPDLLERMGLSVGQVSKPSYQFPVIADEYALWLKRGQLGAREQAKGLARAFDSHPGWEVFQQLSRDEQNAFQCARIIQSVDRDNTRLIDYWLRQFGFSDQARFARVGEEALWKLLEFSNEFSLRSIEQTVSDGMKKASAARIGNKTAAMEAELLRIKDFLASHEQLAALSKLDQMTLFNLGQTLPTNLTFREEWKALYELMSEGVENSADDAFLMARRLIQVAVSQGRLARETGLSSIQALRRGQSLTPEVEQIVAVVRRELSELAAVRTMTTGVETLADCQGILRLWSKNPNSLTLSDEVAELVGELARMGDVALLRLGFKDSEIGLLRQLHQARLAGLNPAKIAERLKVSSPTHWKSSLRVMVAVGGAISIYSTIKTLSDPNIPEDRIEQTIAESVYAVFPSVGLALEGLPLAADAALSGYEVDSKALATGVTLSVLEIVGLTGPVGAAIAAVPLITYGTYAGLTYLHDTDQDRRFVSALYSAIEDKDTLAALKVAGGNTRSFETRGLAIVPNVGNKSLDIIHTPAFVDLYTQQGDVLLDAGPDNKFDIPIRTALREYAKRNVWNGNKDLETWETAVRRYFPSIDLDKVESWNLAEVSQQAVSVDGTPFKVGAHLVRRYINTRNMLTESTINQLKTRVTDMVTTIRSADEWRDKLAQMEVDLTMEKRIVPNAETEVRSFLEWVKTAALSNATRIEQVGAIWKRHLKTYGEAVTQYQRWSKIYQDVGLSIPAANELFGLTGIEADDKGRIDRVYEAFQNAYGKAAGEFRQAKGAPYDESVAFDRDAWARLLNLRLNIFQAEFFKTTPERLTRLEREVEDVLEEIRVHYAGKPEAEIRVTPSDLSEGDTFAASVAIIKGSLPKNPKWVWQGSGGISLNATSGTSVQGSAGGSGSVSVSLLDGEGKTVLALTAQVTAKAKDNKDGDGKDGKDGKTDANKPTCSFEYTEWSPCDRATKKQTHTVKARTPANCIERNEPVLEQACTPPPTEEEKRLAFLSCLCRACGGTMGGYFNTGDGCGNARPCACWGVFNCWSTPIPRGADLIKSCYAGVYGVKDPSASDLDKALDDVRKENRKHLKPLKVTLNQTCPVHVQLGDILNLNAGIEGGLAPHTYSWTGEGMAKDGQFTFANSRKPASYTISVTVNDDDGNSATAQCQVIVDTITVEIEQTEPVKKDPIPVGGYATFRATVASGDRQASGELLFRWQPHPEVLFGTDEKPLFETKDGTTKATYTRTGRYPMWVQVLKKMGDSYQTIGESEQLPIEVVNPKLALQADKPNPVVGELVAITVKEEPEMGDALISFWWEYQGDANNPGPVPNVANSRAWSYKPKNDKPVTVTVHAKAKDGGEELASESITLTAQKAEITVTGPRLAGPAPMIWKEGVGLVPAERQVAEHQRVEFAVSVNPAVGDLRYEWRVDPSGCTIHSPYSKETGVTCSQTGSYTLTVTVKNADGAELGSGTGSLSVTVSQTQITQGQQKANASKQLDAAKQLWGQKKYDEAVAQAEAAAQIDKNLATPILNQFSKGLKDMGWDALNKGERDTAIKRLEQAVRLNPNDADAKKKLADARDHVAKWPQVEAKVKVFDEHIANKRIWSAQREMLAIQDILRTMAAGQSSNNPTWKRVMDDFNAGLQDYNRFSQEKSARHTEYFKSEDYPAMLKNAESMRERELSPADEKECQSRIDFAKRYLQAAELGRQSEALTQQGRFEEALAVLEQGRKIDYKQTANAAKALSDATKRLGKAALERRDFAEAGKHYAIALKVDPQDGEAIGGDVNAKSFQKYADQLRAWQSEIDANMRNGDWDKSEFRLGDYDRVESMLPGERYPKSLEMHQLQKEGYAAYKAWVEPLKQQVGRYMQHRCLDKARATIMEMRARHLIWMDQDWTRAFLETIDEEQRTCSAGGVRLDNDCGRICAIDGESVAGGNDTLLSGKAYNCHAIDANSGKRWSCTIKLGGSAGNVTGELSWSSLDSVHRISGSQSGQTLRFSETSAIKAGSAHLNVDYTLTASGTTMTGTYRDRGDGSTGTFTIDLGGTSGNLVNGKPVSADGNGATLALDSDILEPNASIKLRWSAPADVPNNTWVGLIPSDKPHGKTSVNDQFDMAYKYVDKVRSGAMTFTAPNAAGRYDLRMNNPANDKELVSITFEVKVAGGAATLTLPKSVYAPNEKVTVSFTASAGYPKNTWVGLIPSDKPHGKTSVNDQFDMAYKYVDGKSQGTLEFIAPNGQGSYDLRMNETTNDKEIASVGFKVAVPVENAELSLAKSAFKPGEEIRLGFVASTLLPKNTWVGLIPSDKAHGKTSVNDQFDVAYKYVDGKASGQMVFAAPGSEGSWDFRMSETTNDREVVSITFRVDKNAPATGTPIKSTTGAGSHDSNNTSGPVVGGVPVNKPPTYTGPGIQVQSGNYGHNCGAPFYNATDHLANTCNGKARCEYVIDYQIIGDPVPGCSKDYVAVWKCPNDSTWYAADARPEAGYGKKIVLECQSQGGDGQAATVDRGEIVARNWRFGRADGFVIAEPIRLTENGKIQGYSHPNEDNWTLENGVLVFRNPSSQVITRFNQRKTEAGRLILSGPYLPDPRTTHVLTEVGRIDTTPVSGNFRELLGNWAINANGWTGKVEFSESGGQLTGRVWFDAHGVWETFQTIRFDGRTLSFLRPGPNQRYTGILSGNTVKGTFDGRYDWLLTRGSGSTQPGGPDHTSDTISSEPPPVSAGAKPVLEDVAGPYSWIDATEVQTRKVKSGRAAFLSNGNDHFTHRLGLVGNYAGQYRYLDFWLYFDKPGADIQIQTQVDGIWGKRWGFDAGPKYDGYDWAMEGTTVNQPTGQWLHLRLDLIEQLKIHAGQAITGMGFSSNNADVYYDAVYLVPSATPLPAPAVQTTGKRVLEDDAGPYKWIDGTVVQKEVVAHGQAAFRSDGNDHFTADLGIVGDYPEQFRSATFWVFPIGPEADIQLQVQVDGVWGKRWGFDAGPKYNGYDWAMEGTTTGLKPGVWQALKVDLLRDLKINPGQRITGMAFSSDNGDVYYDSVYLHPNPNPALKASFQPTGKRVLEDDAGGHGWIDGTEVQDFLVFHGSRAFRSNGNDHFTADLGVAGNGAGQFRAIGFWAFLMGPQADMQLQVQVNGNWGKRWGFEAGPKYDGYGWEMEGTTVNMTSGRWTWVQVDLLSQLKLKPGDKITGMAFSSDNADVAYDSVYLLPANAAPGIGAGTPAGAIETGGRDYTASSAPRGKPLGCYRDAGERDLKAYTFQDNRMSTEMCVSACALRGYSFAATQYASHCFCDNQYGKFGGASNCNMACAGAVGELCGGSWANSVYGTGIGAGTTDGPGGRDYTAETGARIKPGQSSEAIGPSTNMSAPGKGSLILEIGNTGGVQNNPSGGASEFSLSRPQVITQIQTYHWNFGRGANPGKITIKDSRGNSVGTWQASGISGSGAQNVNWRAQPNITLPAGIYTVTDSDKATWSHNSQSGNRGFVRIEGYPASSATQYGSAPPPAQPGIDSSARKIDEGLKQLEKMLDIFK